MIFSTRLNCYQVLSDNLNSLTNKIDTAIKYYESQIEQLTVSSFCIKKNANISYLL